MSDPSERSPGHQGRRQDRHPDRHRLRAVAGAWLLGACVIQAPLLTVPSPAVAQLVTETEPEPRQGEVRIQGRSQEDTGPNLDDGPGGILLDFRETMRDFVSNIGEYARGYRPDFAVFTADGLDLLVKRDETDEELSSPARTYMRSIDGVLATNLFAGAGGANKPDDNPELAQRRLSLLNGARQNGLSVFVLDYASDQAVIDEGRSRAGEIGAVYAARNQAAFESTVLPDYPSRPFGESANSIVSSGAIRNFAVIGNSSVYGRQDEFALKMHQSNYDLLIVDVFHGRQPLSKQAVETLKYKASGARRKVFAWVDIGTAASYRYYWQPHWHEGVPPWLGSPLRSEPDRYFVNFWDPEWQRIIFGDTASYIYGVIDQGYDGVILSGIDNYEIFEGGEAAERRLQQ